jgi:hypothetical protein
MREVGRDTEGVSKGRLREENERGVGGVEWSGVE